MANEFIIIKWYASDVMDRANENGEPVTETEANKVLKYMKKAHDCNHGITWDTIDAALYLLKNGGIQ